VYSQGVGQIIMKRLLRSYTAGVDAAFRSTADEIIEDERRKRHDLLASELEAILDDPGVARRPAQCVRTAPAP
jgi:hypothetical protein